MMNISNDDLRPLQDHELTFVSGGVADLPANLLAILNQEHQRSIPMPAAGCPLGGGPNPR